MTELDGLDIHFLHVQSAEAQARPLLMTHGWPGSVVEFHKVIGTAGRSGAHGGRAEEAFHVVCPSLPGYGFSAKPKQTGWGVEKIANAWNTLMQRLGYTRYFAQGGDWGSAVTTAIGLQNLGQCAGIHVNMPNARAQRMRWRIPMTRIRRPSRRALLRRMGRRLFQTAKHSSANSGLWPSGFTDGASRMDHRKVL